MRFVNDDIFATPTVRAGRFRCSVDFPDFADSGRPRSHIVVFPRTGVWIQHAGSRPFVADPNVVTIYNPGQEYTRAPLCADGDRSDWYGVAPAVAFAIAKDLDPSVEANPERPFRAQFVPSDPRLYARQRLLFGRLRASLVEPLEAEESIIGIVAVVIRSCYPDRRPRPRPSAASQEAHRDLAMRAKAELARDVAAPTDVTALARTLGVSPYHLCRVFREQTGTTLHRYRLDLRLRLALERLPRPRCSLSQLALELGFSSHSHFTAAWRQRFAFPPSRARKAFGRNAATELAQTELA